MDGLPAGRGDRGALTGDRPIGSGWEMKRILTISLALISLLLPTACSIPIGNFPIAIAGSWELEPGLYVTLSPGDDGSLEIDLEGEGMISEGLLVTDGALEYTSTKTGIRYRIEPGRNGGKPRFSVVGPDKTEAIKPESIPTISAEK